MFGASVSPDGHVPPLGEASSLKGVSPCLSPPVGPACPEEEVPGPQPPLLAFHAFYHLVPRGRKLILVFPTSRPALLLSPLRDGAPAPRLLPANLCCISPPRSLWQPSGVAGLFPSILSTHFRFVSDSPLGCDLLEGRDTGFFLLS